MEAACRGARSSSRYREGDTIGIVPGHDPREANPFVDVAIASGLDHGRNSIVAHADAVVAIGCGAGTLSEICFGWTCKRLVIALRVEGWSGRLADQRVDDRSRYPDIPEDRVYGSEDPTHVLSLLDRQLWCYRGSHAGIKRHS